MGDNAGQHARVKALFLAVCEAPAEEREALLEQAAADDPELRHEVLELLTFYEHSLAAQARVTASIAPPARETPATIGPYRLLQKLGEGGMGAVFEAEQLQPIRRRVAAWARLEIARCHARSGDLDEARRLYHHAVPVATQPEVSAPDRYRLGTLEALIGEQDRALTSLRQALEPGFAPAAMLDDPDLASLRGDPALEALVAAVRKRLARG